MSNDHQMFTAPFDVTFTRDDGSTETRRQAGATHKRGNNAPLRKIKNPLLRVTCRTVIREPDGSETVRTVLFGVVWRNADGRHLLVSREQWLPGVDPLAYSIPLDMDGFPGGACPCGRSHSINLELLRDVATQLEGQPTKARTVQIDRVSLR
jgi:hypothetical protein